MTTSTAATQLPEQPQAKPQRKARVMRTRSQWQALLGEFDTGGLTRTAFCKKHRIATSSFYRWQQLLAEPADGATGFIDVTEPLSTTSAVPPAHHEHDNHWQVELELGPGIVLRLRTR